MQCHEFVERMQALLDERRSVQSDPQLRAHARECVACREDLHAWELLGRLDRTSTPAPPGGFAERVVSLSATGPATYRPGNRSRPWILAGALAALAAAVLLAVSLIRNSEQPKAGTGTLATDGIGGKQHSSTANRLTNPPTAIAVQATDDRVSSQGPSDPMDIERLQQYSEAFQSLASQVPQAVESFDDVEQATPGLRPVRTSFSLAIGTIRRTIPPQRKEKPQSKPSKRDSSGTWAEPAPLV